MEDAVIVGSSGFAYEIRALIKRTEKYNFLGFIDVRRDNADIIGNDEFLINYQKELSVVIAIANPQIRKRLVARYAQNINLKFPNVIDPDAIFLDTFEIGTGNIICAGNILTVDIHIGDFNIINLSCTIGHEANIGNYVTLNPGVNISGKVILKDEVTVGTGTQILDGGIVVGHSSIIGAGAVVTKEIPEYCTAVGVPAKVIKMLK